MPAKDIFHNTVKLALEKDGWLITDDPIYLDYGGIELYIDLGAEKLITAEKEEQKIAVEVKSFISGSAISEFHKALGQLINYRIALSQKQPEHELYLAIPNITYLISRIRRLKSRLPEQSLPTQALKTFLFH